MSLPTLSVKVAFASNPFDPTLTWVEIGPASGAGPGNLGWARKITTKRGRERLLRTQAQFQAGKATVALDNRDRRFDPTNTSSPYSPNVQPEKCIQIGATWSGTYYPIWTGYVDDWPQAWPGFAEAETAVEATDLFKAFALMRVLSAGYSNQVAADGATNFWRLNEPPQPVGGPVAFAADSVGTQTGSYQGTCGLGDTPPMPQDPATSVNLMSSGSSPLGWVNINTPSASSPTSTFSVEAWVYSPAWGDGTSGNYILDWITSVSSGGNTVIYDTHFEISRTGDLGLKIGDTAGNYISTFATSALTTGAWHHVAATVSAAGTITLYVDGQVAPSSTTTSGVPAAFTPQYQTIGGGPQNLPPFPAFAGKIADVAFYSGVVLTAAQVANHFNLGSFGNEYTGQGVAQVLKWLGFPTSRQNVDTGHTYCAQDTQSETSTKVLDFLQKLEQSEQGQLYIAANGNVVFQDRYHRYTSSNAASQATLGDGGQAYPSEIPYAMGGVTLNFDRVELFNQIAVTRRGGNLQEATNQSSITEFTNRSAPGLSDLLMATDQDALYCAQWIVADTAFPQFRVGQLVIDPRVDDRWWPVVLGLDIGQVITINKHLIPGGGPAVSLVCRIEGIEHQIDPPKGWRTTMHVSRVSANPWMIYDDPVSGFYDIGARWGW